MTVDILFGYLFTFVTRFAKGYSFHDSKIVFCSISENVTRVKRIFATANQSPAAARAAQWTTEQAGTGPFNPSSD